MRKIVLLAGLAALLASCSTVPERPVAPAKPVITGKPLPYRWTQGNAPQAHQDAVAVFGRVALKPGGYLWAANIPAEGETKPDSMRSSVVLPDPLGPSRQRTSPAATSRLTSRTASTPQ